MNYEQFFYNCSKEYIHSIDSNLYKEILNIISKLPKRATQSEINQDLLWLFTNEGWICDKISTNLPYEPPYDLGIENYTRENLYTKNVDRSLCLTSTTLETSWKADFAKMFNNKLVQIEAQFGKKN